MLSIVRVLLQAYGARQVHESAEASEAFETFRRTYPDIVIVDYQMTPNGIDIGAAPRTAQIPMCRSFS